MKKSIEVLHRPSHGLLNGSSEKRPIEETRKTRSRLVFDDEPVYELRESPACGEPPACLFHCRSAELRLCNQLQRRQPRLAAECGPLKNDGAARGGSWTEGKLTFIGKLCESPLRRIIISALSAVVA